MTEDELTAHLAAVMEAVPESAVSARQALYSALFEVDRMQKELTTLRQFEREIRAAVVQFTSPGALVVTAHVVPPAPKPPPRLTIVPPAFAGGLTPKQQAKVISLMEDEGQSRAAAMAWVRAFEPDEGGAA